MPNPSETDIHEHLAWCKARAIEYLDREPPEPVQALSSFVSDLSTGPPKMMERLGGKVDASMTDWDTAEQLRELINATFVIADLFPKNDSLQRGDLVSIGSRFAIISKAKESTDFFMGEVHDPKDHGNEVVAVGANFEKLLDTIELRPEDALFRVTEPGFYFLAHFKSNHQHIFFFDGEKSHFLLNREGKSTAHSSDTTPSVNEQTGVIFRLTEGMFSV